MNVYARIRKIENQQEFKRLFNTLLGAEYGHDFQSVKEWHDLGVDGYNKKTFTVYAVYCPTYPERREQSQYTEKIKSDMDKIKRNLDSKKLKLKIKEWVFVTPDDLSIEVINFIAAKAKEYDWESGTLTAQVMTPIFLKHNSIHIDFPDITAGIQLDKIPSIDIRLAENRSYTMLELFNDGTEDIKNIEVSIDKERRVTDHFLYEHDDPMRGHGHSLYNLRKGERQYCNRVPTSGGFNYVVSGVGVESGKTLVKEGQIDKTL